MDTAFIQAGKVEGKCIFEETFFFLNEQKSLNIYYILQGNMGLLGIEWLESGFWFLVPICDKLKEKLSTCGDPRALFCCWDIFLGALLPLDG